MNWSQILAAAIIASVALANLVFTLRGNNARRVFERNSQYIDRQSDAVERWWLFTVQAIPFGKCEKDVQDELIAAAIWLPSDVRQVALGSVTDDDAERLSRLRILISAHIDERLII